MKLIWGSIGFVVIALVALLLFMQSEKKRAAEQAAKEKAEKERVLEEQRQRREEMAEKIANMPVEDDTDGTPAVAEAPKPKPVDVEDARPELREGDLRSIPIPEGKERYRPTQAVIKTYEWPDHVTAEERNKIEQAIEAMIEYGGRDGQEGEAYLVSLDRDQEDGTKFKAVGRLVSQFKIMLDSLDMSDRLTMSKFMALDRTLRKIDGMQERDFRDIDGININSMDIDVERVAKRWNWWYDLEKWRMRREPWDERFDVLDDEAFEDLDAN